MKKYFCVLLLILLFLTACSADKAFEVSLNDVKETKESIVVETEEKSEEDITIYVYVCGAVCNEGVYKLKAGSRIFEALDAAGGFSADAKTDYINLAKELKDGDKIYFPTEDEVVLIESSNDTFGLININTANKEKLMTLPGIGEAKASDIIAYREEKGSFKTIEEIMNISGIKEAAFNKIKGLICAD